MPVYKTFKFLGQEPCVRRCVPRPFHCIRHRLIFDEWITSPSLQGWTPGGHITNNPFTAIYKARGNGYWTCLSWGMCVRHRRPDTSLLVKVHRSARSWSFWPEICFTENTPKKEQSHTTQGTAVSSRNILSWNTLPKGTSYKAAEKGKPHNNSITNFFQIKISGLHKGCSSGLWGLPSFWEGTKVEEGNSENKVILKSMLL